MRTIPGHPSATLEILPCHKRVRVVLEGQTIADSRRVLILRGNAVLPVYYFPPADVKPGHLVPAAALIGHALGGHVRHFTLQAGSRRVEDAAWSFSQPTDPRLAPLDGHVAFAWDAADAWFEEDEEVFVHARDPHVRIDTMQSYDHLQVILEGTLIADSHRPLVLVETGQPVRYYLPLEDVRQDLLLFSVRTTRCPYKGVASWWSARIDGKLHADIAWSYQAPIEEIPRIKGLVAFDPEAVEAILRNGEKLA